MTRDTITFSPATTFLFGCRFDLAFDCENPPSEILGVPRYTWFKSISFGLCQSYEVIGPYLDKATEEACFLPDCAEAKRYQVEFSYKVVERLGIGIGAFALKEIIVRETDWLSGIKPTKCFCCREAAPAAQAAQPKAEEGASEVSGVALAAALAFALLNPETQFSQIFLPLMGIAATIASALALLRHFYFEASYRRLRSAQRENL